MAIISENKKLHWFKGHEIDNSTSINADIIKVSDIVGCEGWALVGSIQAIPIHMLPYKSLFPIVNPKFLPSLAFMWPSWRFFQLQNVQLNRFIKGTPSYVTKTLATGFQYLGYYVAKTTFYFIEEPIVKWPYFFDSGALVAISAFQSLNKLGPLVTNQKNKATFLI